MEAAWKRGARFDAWTECFNEQAWRDAALELRLDPASIAQTTYDTARVMPWSHISTGVSTKFLSLERKRAQKGVTTPDCTFGSCTACGACPSLAAENEVVQQRVAAGARFQEGGQA